MFGLVLYYCENKRMNVENSEWTAEIEREQRDNGDRWRDRSLATGEVFAFALTYTSMFLWLG